MMIQRHGELINRNLQIVSSRNGLNLVTTDVAAKMRSDQIYTRESMERMMKFYFDNCENEKQLFVAGMYPNLLFHPRDHVFWGKTNSLKNLFDTPLEIDGFGDKSKLPKSEFGNTISISFVLKRILVDIIALKSILGSKNYLMNQKSIFMMKHQSGTMPRN